MHLAELEELVQGQNEMPKECPDPDKPLTEYMWYQKVVAAWMALGNRGGLVWHDAGTGKTCTMCLCMAAHAMQAEYKVSDMNAKPGLLLSFNDKIVGTITRILSTTNSGKVVEVLRMPPRLAAAIGGNTPTITAHLKVPAVDRPVIVIAPKGVMGHLNKELRSDKYRVFRSAKRVRINVFTYEIFLNRILGKPGSNGAFPTETISKDSDGGYYTLEGSWVSSDKGGYRIDLDKLQNATILVDEAHNLVAKDLTKEGNQKQETIRKSQLIEKFLELKIPPRLFMFTATPFNSMRNMDDYFTLIALAHKANSFKRVLVDSKNMDTYAPKVVFHYMPTHTTDRRIAEIQYTPSSTMGVTYVNTNHDGFWENRPRTCLSNASSQSLINDNKICVHKLSHYALVHSVGNRWYLSAANDMMGGIVGKVFNLNTSWGQDITSKRGVREIDAKDVPVLELLKDEVRADSALVFNRYNFSSAAHVVNKISSTVLISPRSTCMSILKQNMKFLKISNSVRAPMDVDGGTVVVSRPPTENDNGGLCLRVDGTGAVQAREARHTPQRRWSHDVGVGTSAQAGRLFAYMGRVYQLVGARAAPSEGRVELELRPYHKIDHMDVTVPSDNALYAGTKFAAQMELFYQKIKQQPAETPAGRSTYKVTKFALLNTIAKVLDVSSSDVERFFGSCAPKIRQLADNAGVINGAAADPPTRQFVYMDEDMATGWKPLACTLMRRGWTLFVAPSNVGKVVVPDSSKTFAVVRNSMFNHARNTTLQLFNAHKINLIILESNYSEGITLSDVTHVHIYNVPKTYKKLHQAIRRGVRLCRHSDAYRAALATKGGVDVRVYAVTCYDRFVPDGRVIQSVYNDQLAKYNAIQGRSGVELPHMSFVSITEFCKTLQTKLAEVKTMMAERPLEKVPPKTRHESLSMFDPFLEYQCSNGFDITANGELCTYTDDDEKTLYGVFNRKYDSKRLRPLLQRICSASSFVQGEVGTLSRVTPRHIMVTFRSKSISIKANDPQRHQAYVLHVVDRLLQQWSKSATYDKKQSKKFAQLVKFLTDTKHDWRTPDGTPAQLEEKFKRHNSIHSSKKSFIDHTNVPDNNSRGPSTYYNEGVELVRAEGRMHIYAKRTPADSRGPLTEQNEMTEYRLRPELKWGRQIIDLVRMTPAGALSDSEMVKLKDFHSKHIVSVDANVLVVPDM